MGEEVQAGKTCTSGMHRALRRGCRRQVRSGERVRKKKDLKISPLSRKVPQAVPQCVVTAETTWPSSLRRAPRAAHPAEWPPRWDENNHSRHFRALTCAGPDPASTITRNPHGNPKKPTL